MAQIRWLDREIHAHRARHQDHDCVRVNSFTIAETTLGDELAISIAIPFGNRIVIAATSEVTSAGISVSDSDEVASRFLHQ